MTPIPKKNLYSIAEQLYVKRMIPVPNFLECFWIHKYQSYIYVVPFLLVPNDGVPNGWVPNDWVPKGWVPNGRVPKGWVPNGRVPKGWVPIGGVPIYSLSPSMYIDLKYRTRATINPGYYHVGFSLMIDGSPLKICSYKTRAVVNRVRLIIAWLMYI